MAMILFVKATRMIRTRIVAWPPKEVVRPMMLHKQKTEKRSYE